MPLGDLTELVDYGVTASATEQPIGPKFLRITDIQNGAVNWATVPSCQSDNRTLSNARLKPGDIVFARTGATTGKSFLIRECPTDSVFASYLIRVRMGHSADPRFISHFFQTPNYWTQITSSACGVAQPGINATRLKALKIPLPPLAEQQRIAEVLDRVETLRSKRRAGLAQLDSLTQSLFLDLYRNTVDSSSTLPLSYLAETTRGSFVNGPFGSNLLTSELHEEGVPVIYIRDIRDGDYTRVSKSCVTERKARELAVYSVRSGDVLVAKVGDPPGIAAIYPDGEPGGIVTQDVIRIRVSPHVAIPQFVVGYLNSSIGRWKVAGITIEATRARFSLKDFKAINIELPSITLQREFARRTGAVEKLKTAQRASLTELDAFFASLQFRAFRGEL
jgi:type I restriction enzyme, S subunit